MAASAPRDAKRARPAALEARVSTTELPGLGKVYSVLAIKGVASVQPDAKEEASEDAERQCIYSVYDPHEKRFR